MTPEAKKALEKEAEEFAGSHYTRNHHPKNWNDRYQAYIAGATEYAERLEAIRSEIENNLNQYKKNGYHPYRPGDTFTQGVNEALKNVLFCIDKFKQQ